MHNFNTKGLFYWIPPLKDSSLLYEDGDQDIEGLIRNDPSVIKNLIFIFNQNRIHDFFYQITSSAHLPYTVFFSSLLLLMILLILLIWIIPKKKNFTLPSAIKESHIEQSIVKHAEDSNSSFFDPTSTSLKNQDSIFIEGIEERIPSLKTINHEESINIDIPTCEETKLEKDLESLQEIELKSINANQSSFLYKLMNNKIVLDPGSANRLYIEGKLTELKDIYMVKSSSKKISNEVTDKITKIELTIQDQIKSSLFKDTLNTFEEAGKALALCKKLKILYYISSYKLPSNIQGIHVIHISDALI